MALPPGWAQRLLLALALLVTTWPVLGRASFEVDDCRYFAALAAIDAGEPDAWRRALVVENRWDQDWWVPDGAFVRFLRPWVAPSYALDRALFGIDPTGSVAVNLLLHFAVVLLVHALLVRLIGAGWPAFLGALLFTTMSCHAEHLWYVAGRTDTIGGLFFAATLLWHLRTRERATVATHAITAMLWFGALLAKELTIWLPPLLLLLDRWVPPRGAAPLGWRAQLRATLPLWLACATVFASWLALRAWLLGPGGSGSRPFPYFFLPDRDGFVPRTLAVLGQYLVGLASGETVVPFLAEPARFWQHVHPIDLAAGLIGVPLVLGWGLGHPLGRFAVLLLLLLLVPMLPVYSSNRYLYLPSIAWCLLIASLLQRQWRARPLLAGAIALLAILPTSVRLPAMMHNAPYRRSHMPSQAWDLAEMFRQSDLRLEHGRPVYLLDFPKEWLELQFLRPTIAILRGGDPPPLRALCMAPREAPQWARLTPVDAQTIELDRGGRRLHQPNPQFDFDPRVVAPGDRIRERDYEVEVLSADAGAATRIRVRFDRPLDELEFGRFTYGPGGWILRRIR